MHMQARTQEKGGGGSNPPPLKRAKMITKIYIYSKGVFWVRESDHDVACINYRSPWGCHAGHIGQIKNGRHPS